MAEKTAEFEAGTATEAVTGGAGAISGLNSVANGTGGSTKYDPDSAFFGSLGITILNGAGSNATSRQFIDAAGATLATTATKMSYVVGAKLPSLPTESECYWESRLLPSAGGARLYYQLDGTIKLISPVAGGGTFTLLTSAERATVADQKILTKLQFDAASPNSISATAFTAKCFTAAGVQVGSTVTGVINQGASGAMAGHGIGRIIGLTNSRAYGFDHLGLNDGVLTDIPDALTRLTTPNVVLVSSVNPTTTSGTNGVVTVSWANVSGASRYDAYRATVGGAPGQGDFTLYATGVTSPYDFTGQAAGTYHYGIKAIV